MKNLPSFNLIEKAKIQYVRKMANENFEKAG